MRLREAVQANSLFYCFGGVFALNGYRPWQREHKIQRFTLTKSNNISLKIPLFILEMSCMLNKPQRMMLEKAAIPSVDTWSAVLEVCRKKKFIKTQ